MIRTKGEGAEAAGRAVADYRHQAEQFAREAEATGQAAESVRSQYESARFELATALLPDAHPQRLAAIDANLATDLGLRRSSFEQKRAEWTARLAEIQSDSDFAQRETLLHPYSGELKAGLEQAENERRKYENEMVAFDGNSTFQWAIKRHEEVEEGTSGFKSFWRAVTLSSTREQIAQKKLCKDLDFPDWSSLVDAYRVLSNKQGYAFTTWVALNDRRKKLDALVIEAEDLDGWVNRFEEQLTYSLRATLAETLDFADLTALHRQAPPELKPLLARMHALQAKQRYLASMRGYLDNEIADRRKRAAGIERVRHVWQRKPWDRLYSDKTKWLVTVPEMKRNGTEKRLRMTRRMRENIVAFDDYDSYNTYWCELEDDYLPYDTFAYCSHERMPYEGFSRTLIPDLDEHRRHHGWERADYSAYKEADQAGDWVEEDEVEEADFEEAASDMDDVADDAMGALLVYEAAELIEHGDAS
ncbi:MAG: hypothetical protein AB7S38_11745 [Vulcanimicrobiota bacterium]